MSSHWLQHCSTAACSYTPPSTFLTHFYVILTPDTPGLPGTPSGGLMARRGDGDGFCLQTSGGREGLIRFENLGSRIRGNWVVMNSPAISPTATLTLMVSESSCAECLICLGILLPGGDVLLQPELLPLGGLLNEGVEVANLKFGKWMNKNIYRQQYLKQFLD